jgi:SulP family sulfate permease
MATICCLYRGRDNQMDLPAQQTRQAGQPTFTELFTPKLVTVLREGYGFAKLRADLIAGLTVAIVALPLSMAIAIASGTTPERGLYTASVGGFLISAFGGSRFQIGGPAAAFTVLVALTINRVGLDGLLLATMMAGAFLLALGFLRLGTYIKFIPFPVTVGFIAGIALTLLAGQIHDLLGLTLAGHEPAQFIPKLQALWGAIGTVNPAAVAIAVATVCIILGLKKLRPQWPGMLIAIVAVSVAGALLGLPIETIGTRFGGIPGSLPLPSLPPFSLAKMQSVLPDAISLALLGAVESLLSAVAADGMTGRRHRSNMELVAQGLANIGSAVFGGICATGTIARTATNVRAGATSPVAGMSHAAFVLLFMLVAAPLASFIPLASLAGVLVVVSWNMVEKHELLILLRSSRGDALILLTTIGLTIFRGLTEAIIVGFSLGALLFIHRMAQSTNVETQVPLGLDDKADDSNGARTPYDPRIVTDPDVAVYRITGAFFFGGAATVGSVLDSIGDRHKAFVIDFSAVPFIDSTAANTIGGVARKAQRSGVSLLISGASPAVRQSLLSHGVRPPAVTYEPSLDNAIATAHTLTAALKQPNAVAR